MMAKPMKSLELHYPMIQFFNNMQYHTALNHNHVRYCVIIADIMKIKHILVQFVTWLKSVERHCFV